MVGMEEPLPDSKATEASIIKGETIASRLEEEAQVRAAEAVEALLATSYSDDLSRLPALLASQRQQLQVAEAALLSNLNRHDRSYYDGFGQLDAVTVGCEGFSVSIDETSKVCKSTDIGAPKRFENEINELSNAMTNITTVVDFAERLVSFTRAYQVSCAIRASTETRTWTVQQDIPDTTAEIMEILQDSEQDITAVDLYHMYYQLETLAPVQSIVMGAFEQYQNTDDMISEEHELSRVSHDLFDGLLNQINFAYGQLNGALWQQVKLIEQLCEHHPQHVDAILEIVERQDAISKAQLEAEDSSAPIHPQNYYMDTLMGTIGDLVEDCFENLRSKVLPQGFIIDMVGLQELVETEEFMLKIVAPYFPSKYRMKEFLVSKFSFGLVAFVGESLDKVLPASSNGGTSGAKGSRAPSGDDEALDSNGELPAPTIQNSHILEIIQFILTRTGEGTQQPALEQDPADPASPRLTVMIARK